MRTPRTTKTAAAAVVGAAALLLPACASAMTWEQKVEHLRDMANKGADAHYILKTESKETTKEVCDQHYFVFVDGAPAEDGIASSLEWKNLSREYFVDSCVKGEPREIQTRPTTPSSTPSTTPAETSVSVAPAG